MRRAARVLLVTVAVVAGGVPVYSLCSHSPGDTLMCGTQCTWGSRGVYCGVSSDDKRACWSSDHACGEAADYEECNCTGGGGPGGF